MMPNKRRRRPRAKEEHVHLPSVHVRDAAGAGYDYDEDYTVTLDARGLVASVVRVVRMQLLDAGGLVARVSSKSDQLCPKDAVMFFNYVPVLAFPGAELDPDVIEHMQVRAGIELARQARIIEGAEQACAGCGCSVTAACSGGCIWTTQTLCSRCAR